MIDIAADLGCSVRRISEHLEKDELTLWLARYMMKAGYTYDQSKIKQQRIASFMARARNSWKQAWQNQ